MLRKGWDGVYMLQTESGAPVNIGDTLTDFRGDTAIVESGYAPHKSNSTGRVNDYYPSVFDCKWVKQ